MLTVHWKTTPKQLKDLDVKLTPELLEFWKKVKLQHNMSRSSVRKVLGL